MNILEVSSVKKLELFLSNGGDINEKISSGYYTEENLLIHILRTNPKVSVRLVKKLIENGININYENSDNENALFHVKDIRIAKLLVKNGINIKVFNKNKYDNPLTYVTPEITEYYLKIGMNICHKNKFGQEYFELIADSGSPNIEKLQVGLNELQNHVSENYPTSIVKAFLKISLNTLKRIDLIEEQKEIDIINIKKMLQKENFDFAKGVDYFIEFFDFGIKMEKMFSNEEKSFMFVINEILSDVYLEIIKRNDDTANNFKSSFMEKINFEYYSLLQRNQLNEVLTQKSPLLTKKVVRL
ncbi:TPA: hypothetical protein NV714_000075 [Escherichia coli]|nr:hypothetical protein [Escherichia coli]